MHSLGRLVLLVNDYDTAISFYQDKLGMEVFADMPVGQQRYVHLRLPSQPAVGVWLLFFLLLFPVIGAYKRTREVRLQSGRARRSAALSAGAKG